MSQPFGSPTLEIALPSFVVLQINRIALNVADLDVACAFYVDALGFRLQAKPSAACAILRLGRQNLELRVCRGRPYPEPRAANDPWFQHFAIAVSDMKAAYGRLRQYDQQPISDGGPQLLPPSTGSVTAYKFRDPDGHPLELSHIPGSAWLTEPQDRAGPCLGIDHSALAVADLAASLAFYKDTLGFVPAGQGLNEGAEQDRLDGLAQTRVDILALAAAGSGPHIELLHYRAPLPTQARQPIDPEDIAATRLILRTATVGEGRTLLRDPDGHLLELAEDL